MAIVFGNMTLRGGFQFTNSSSTPPGPTPLSDQYFQYTTLLLDGLGANNTQNNTFLDSSSNNFTITRNGNTTQGSFTPFSHDNGYWSNYFDGNGDSLTIANNAAFNFETGDFTIETWINATSVSNSPAILSKWANSNDNWLIRMESDNTVRFYYKGGSIATTQTISLNEWTHVAITRSSNNCRIFVNGVQTGSTVSVTANLTNTTNLSIGAYSDGTNFFTGYISNVRIVKGTAVYTSNFTPSTTPLTAITNTQLLTCQSNNFKDNSTNNFAITRNGDTRVTLFQPFTLSSEYNSSTMGGSMYFDGSNDRLTVANNAAFNQTGSWTVEMWIYSVKRGAAQYFYTQSTSGYAQLTLNSSNLLEIDVSGVGVRATSTSAIPANAWTHVAMVSNGTQIRLFVNGVLQGSAAAFTGVNSAKAVTIGSYDSPSLYFGGYISNLRVVAGTAVYTTNFTPPTAPVTAISGTSLLLNGTNAGIVDSTGFNDAETVGDAKISTAQSKWGGSSMYFDGSGDYLQLLSTMPIYNTPLTIETWIYPSSRAYIMPVFVENTGGDNGEQLLKITTAGELMFEQRSTAGYGPNIFLTTTSTLALNTWSHIALVLTTGGPRIYINGVLGASNDGVRYWANNAQNPTIGFNPYQGTSQTFNGYMQGFRITAGIARYTGTFTPPTDY